MRYSRFNAELGLYEVFEDTSTHALNGDFPVPRLGPDAGRIGIPATEAGRELPARAKRVGTSWHAKGLVVRPRQPALGGLGDSDTLSTVLTVGFIGVVAVVAAYIGSLMAEDLE